MKRRSAQPLTGAEPHGDAAGAPHWFDALFGDDPQAVALVRQTPAGPRLADRNRALLSLLGCGPGDDPDPAALLDPDDAHAGAVLLQRLLAGVQSASCASRCLRLRSGATVWTEVSARHVRDPLDGTAQVLVRLEDITARRHLKEALQQIAGQFQQVERLGRIGYWEWDEIRDCMVSCSEGYARLFDLTVAEALERMGSTDGFLELVHPEDRDRVRAEAFGPAGQTGRRVTQYRIITPTGNGRFLQTTADPVRDDTGLVVRTFGTTMDITALREAEQALRDSESRHRLLVETMNHGMGALDRDMTFTFVNDKLCEIFGCGRETLIGMRLPALLDAENSAILARQWELRRNHGQDPYELAVLRPDGSRRHTIVAPVPLYDAVGNFLGSFATMTDITERKHMEEELRRSEEKFAKAFRTSLEAWFISDMETACFVDFNDAFVALIGHTRDQLLACDALALGIWAQPEERPRFMALLEAKGQIRNAVIEVRTRGGDIRVVEMSAQMIEIGGRRRFLGMLRDISERLRLERELQRHREHLEAEVVRRTAELTSANEELRAMAHSIFPDLKAPLRAVEGFATWLREDCGAELDTRGLEYLERIAASTQRMGEMIDDLLALARLGERVTLASVDMALVWSRARADLAENIRASGARVSVAGTLPRVHGHQATLEALLRNLLSNALKFVKPGVPPRVTLAVAPDGPRYRFCVSDNGIGIAPEYRERIFDLFERLHTREEYPGTGVGLALVRKAVQIHGGSLNVESSPGQGSAFWFTLSADPSPTPSLSCPTPHLAPP